MPASKTPRSKHPVSARQLNRANAARSTGPRTPEGKARSSQNARRHRLRRDGFAAADFAVVRLRLCRLEDLQAVANLRADLVSVCQPINSQELFALERMALAQQALLRASRLEAGLFTSSLNEALDPSGNPILPMSEVMVGDLQVTRAQNRNYALAEGFRRLAQEGNTWALFLRYQAQAERHYRRAVEEFEHLKAQRGELPNEPISEIQPDENSTPSAPPETNPIQPPNGMPPGAETCDLAAVPLGRLAASPQLAQSSEGKPNASRSPKHCPTS